MGPEVFLCENKNTHPGKCGEEKKKLVAGCNPPLDAVLDWTVDPIEDEKETRP
jgi:hypothetical protein